MVAECFGLFSSTEHAQWIDHLRWLGASQRLILLRDSSLDRRARIPIVCISRKWRFLIEEKGSNDGGQLFRL